MPKIIKDTHQPINKQMHQTDSGTSNSNRWQMKIKFGANKRKMTNYIYRNIQTSCQEIGGNKSFKQLKKMTELSIQKSIPNKNIFQNENFYKQKTAKRCMTWDVWEEERSSSQRETKRFTKKWKTLEMVK